MTIPKAVPAAGGCSVSIITMMKMESPTASEYTIMEWIEEGCGSKAHKEPNRKPTRCPPITFLGLAVMLFGIANTMKAVAPIDDTITACSMLNKRSTMNTVNIAMRLWKT